MSIIWDQAHGLMTEDISGDEDEGSLPQGRVNR